MPAIFPLRSLILLKLYRFLLLLLFLQRQRLPVTCQSFAELASVQFGGAGGAGSILPYSSSSRAAGGSGDFVDPNILNIVPKTAGDSNQDLGPVYVGPTRPPGSGQPGDRSGPVFHHVFGNTPGILGPPKGVSSSGTSPSARPKPGGGRLVDPPNRSSLWRERVSGAPVNFNDHQLNCGAQHVSIFKHFISIRPSWKIRVRWTGASASCSLFRNRSNLLRSFQGRGATPCIDLTIQEWTKNK